MATAPQQTQVMSVSKGDDNPPMSDEEIYIMNESDLKEYRTKDKVKDEELGLLFYD